MDAGTYNLSGGAFELIPSDPNFGSFSTAIGTNFNWSAGNVLSNRPINLNGTTTVSGANTKQLQGLATIGSTFAVTGGTIQALNATTGVSVNNGGLVNIQADGTIFSSTGTLTNAGTLRKSAGAGTSTVQWSLNNTGTIDVQTGTLALTGGGTLNGTVSGAGSLNLSGGTFTTSGTFNNNGIVNLATAYTVAATGTVNVNGRLNINASAITSSGAGAAMNIGSSGVLDIRTADNAFVNTSGTLTNSGTVIKSSNGNQSVINWATTTNNGGLIDVQTGSLQFTNGLTLNSGSQLRVRLLGTATENITKVNVSGGTPTITSGAVLQLDLSALSAAQVQTLRDEIGYFVTRSYTVLTATNTIGGGGYTGPVTISNAGNFDTNLWTFEAVSSGNSVVINFTPVPEPATVLAIGAAGLGIAGWRRRRNAKAQAEAAV